MEDLLNFKETGFELLKFSKLLSSFFRVYLEFLDNIVECLCKIVKVREIGNIGPIPLYRERMTPVIGSPKERLAGVFWRSDWPDVFGGVHSHQTVSVDCRAGFQKGKGAVQDSAAVRSRSGMRNKRPGMQGFPEDCWNLACWVSNFVFIMLFDLLMVFTQPAAMAVNQSQHFILAVCGKEIYGL
ncbi:hypothetical protein Nepgr_001544 [Nepenthes gracilis]|uniref:Uncharacterized protein n=1 Tax=Nepenthes gracilis TaxID=150966 RepID=A0AAD3RXT9_NEPGR|nr:hypothetical protein Nepgr_001544 [Nepenthes gracilis]